MFSRFRSWRAARRRRREVARIARDMALAPVPTMALERYVLAVARTTGKDVAEPTVRLFAIVIERLESTPEYARGMMRDGPYSQHVARGLREMERGGAKVRAESR